VTPGHPFWFAQSQNAAVTALGIGAPKPTTSSTPKVLGYRKIVVRAQARSNSGLQRQYGSIVERALCWGTSRWPLRQASGTESQQGKSLFIPSEVFIRSCLAGCGPNLRRFYFVRVERVKPFNSLHRELARSQMAEGLLAWAAISGMVAFPTSRRQLRRPSRTVRSARALLGSARPSIVSLAGKTHFFL
jgi:hypothetical protein